MAETNPPKVFISYAWEDDLKPWVRKLAKSLRKDGIDVQLDDWELSLGDQLPVFMEKAVRESDFVIFICTPKYKTKSDERKGGVGYEGHIITAEIFGKSNDRKFIPVLRAGKWESSSPSWAGAKNYLDLSGEPYSKTNYKKLVKTLHGKKPGPPPIGAPPGFLDEDEEEENEATREKARKETAEKARLKAEDEERERIAKEKAEREAEEKARQKATKEKAEREAAEKIAGEKAELENAEKAVRKRAKFDVAMRVAQEKAKRETAKKAESEKPEFEVSNKRLNTKQSSGNAFKKWFPSLIRLTSKYSTRIIFRIFLFAIVIMATMVWPEYAGIIIIYSTILFIAYFALENAIFRS